MSAPLPHRKHNINNTLIAASISEQVCDCRNGAQPP
jgi:hypothetical protein